MTTPFVGARRRLVLDRLADDFEAVASGGGPGITFLEAPLGWGKTRLVQELYARLAASQGSPYWPATIVDGAPAESGDEVSRRRKVLSPARFEVPRNAVPEWLWLAVLTDPSAVARPEEAYRSLAEQLEPHVYPILRRQRITKAAARAVLSGLGTLLPLPQDWDSVMTVAGGIREVAEEWWHGGRKTRDVGAPVDASGAFWRLLSQVWGPDGTGGPPLVLVVEDAQFLSEPTVEMFGALLASRLPVLVIATGWPLKDDPRYAPFREFVDAAPARLRVERLDELTSDDAREILTALHPGTADDVAQIVVKRFASNPYALQLFLLNRRARHGEAFDADDVEWLARTPSSVHTELRAILERTSTRARTAVLIASLLGYRFPTQVGDAAARGHDQDASIVDALQTDWLRQDQTLEEILSFIEPMRREVAVDLATAELAPRERQAVVDTAVMRMAQLLSDPEDPDRALLQSLFVELSAEATDADEDLVAQSLGELLMTAWRQRTQQRGLWLLDRLARVRSERMSPVAWAEALVTRARYTRLFVSAISSSLDALTLAAWEAADGVAGERPDLLASALIERGRLVGNKDAGLFDLELAVELNRQADEAAARLAEVPPLLAHSLATRRYGLIARMGRRREAHELALAEAERCRGVPVLSYSEEESLSDAVFYIARVDPNLALVPNQELIDRIVGQLGTVTHPRVAAMRKDLALRMLRTYRDELVTEAFAIADECYRQIVAANGTLHGRALAVLSVRAHARRRVAALRWRAGDLRESEELAAAALVEIEEVARGRGLVQGSSRPSLLTRSSVALAQAWAGDETALSVVRGCVDERIARGEGDDFAELLWLARDYRDALVRHGRDSDAAAAEGEFPAAFRHPYPA